MSGSSYMSIAINFITHCLSLELLLMPSGVNTHTNMHNNYLDKSNFYKPGVHPVQSPESSCRPTSILNEIRKLTLENYGIQNL